MIRLKGLIREKENKFDNWAAGLLQRHPCLGCIVIVAGMPIVLLIAVTFSVTIVMLPVSWFMGWL